MSTELQTVDTSTGEIVTAEKPAAMMALAMERATALADVIEKRKLYKQIGGNRHILIDAWTTCAALHHVVPSTSYIEKLDDGGFEAAVELVNLNTGVKFGRQFGRAGSPTDTAWRERSDNHKMSMAVTRATSKACRMAFGWVVVLAGYESTPAEDFEDDPDRSPGGHKYNKPFKRDIPTATYDPPPVSEWIDDTALARLQSGLVQSGKTEADLCEALGVASVTGIKTSDVGRALKIVAGWWETAHQQDTEYKP